MWPNPICEMWATCFRLSAFLHNIKRVSIFQSINFCIHPSTKPTHSNLSVPSGSLLVLQTQKHPICSQIRERRDTLVAVIIVNVGPVLCVSNQIRFMSYKPYSLLYYYCFFCNQQIIWEANINYERKIRNTTTFPLHFLCINVSSFRIRLFVWN